MSTGLFSGRPSHGQFSSRTTAADRFEYARGQIDPSWTELRDVEVVVVHFWVDSHFKIAGIEPDRRVVKLNRMKD
jgi:hypothetical protein